MTPTIIMGIDPGSRITGFGVIAVSGQKHQYVTSGVIKLGSGELPARIAVLVEGVNDIIHQYKPTMVAVEQVFMATNASAALKLGQARGAAIAAATNAGLEIYEYSARQIKQAVVGKGAAAKEQVQHMVKTLLNLPAAPAEDAADALAGAICHAHYRESLKRLDSGNNEPLLGKIRRGRLR